MGRVRIGDSLPLRIVDLEPWDMHPSGCHILCVSGSDIDLAPSAGGWTLDVTT